MKVFISFDMEGVAGIVDWSQCRGPGPAYEEGRRLLLGEVNAAIDGALAAGATEIICNDSHGTMNNLHPEVARTMIAAGARRAVERAAARPPAIALPATLEVQMQTADMAEVASWVRGAERTGVRAVSIRGDDPVAIFRSFVAVTYITRVAEGR
jgi:D-aminopeptidase